MFDYYKPDGASIVRENFTAYEWLVKDRPTNPRRLETGATEQTEHHGKTSRLNWRVTITLASIFVVSR